MRISYNWLKEYLPVPGNGNVNSNMTYTDGITNHLTPEKISTILTAVGLEVENLEKYEKYKGNLGGLIVGEIKECIDHPAADKLKLTKVDIGEEELLQIVCGAHNVSVGQHVVVATVGTTIYPLKAEPLTIKKARIRGIDSNGMLCAEDEIGLGESHDGIIVLSTEVQKGTLMKDLLTSGLDWIFEIGITPNRIDAMSHIGVARDICAWLTVHTNAPAIVRYPGLQGFQTSLLKPPEVEIVDSNKCPRYSGISITNVRVEASPAWLKERIESLGIRPVNNIVDITNFVLHETGQPLHAFDLDRIPGKKIIVKTLNGKNSFITLDGKSRDLHEEDLMICDGNGTPMCIAGVYGGADSGVTDTTINLFIESAFFNPSSIRRSSMHHGLRTDAATRFEKGTDISNTVNVLKRAALLIQQIAGGEIASQIVDIYPEPRTKNEITLKNHYLKKISGKNYHPDTVKKILTSLGFDIIKESMDDIRVAVPFSKPDVELPADVIEEIMRIDGLDNIDIPMSVNIAPATEHFAFEEEMKDRIANVLVGAGYAEIFTNSVTNSKYYKKDILEKAVRIINSLSVELDIMRPSLLESGLERIEYNINRKNQDLSFFEFGKTYEQAEDSFIEKEHLAIYCTGNVSASGWKHKTEKVEFFYLKGICEMILRSMGIKIDSTQTLPGKLSLYIKETLVATIMQVEQETLKIFSIRQPVFFANIYWEAALSIAKSLKIINQEIPKYPTVSRDLSLVVDSDISYSQIELATSSVSISKLISMKLFDVFESEKIGTNKRSFAINYIFSDIEKTLTDKEIDEMMTKLVTVYEQQLHADIRKA